MCTVMVIMVTKSSQHVAIEELRLSLTHQARLCHCVNLDLQVVWGYVNQVHIDRRLEVDCLMSCDEVPDLVHNVVHFDEVLVPQCEYPVQDPVLCSAEVCDDLDNGNRDSRVYSRF